MKENTKDYYIRENLGSFEEKAELSEKIRSNIVWGVGALVLAGVAFGVGDQFIQNDIFKSIVGYGATGVSCLACHQLLKNIKLKAQQPTIAIQEHPKQYKK